MTPLSLEKKYFSPFFSSSSFFSIYIAATAIPTIGVAVAMIDKVIAAINDSPLSSPTTDHTNVIVDCCSSHPLLITPFLYTKFMSLLLENCLDSPVVIPKT